MQHNVHHALETLLLRKCKDRVSLTSKREVAESKQRRNKNTVMMGEDSRAAGTGHLYARSIESPSLESIASEIRCTP